MRCAVPVGRAAWSNKRTVDWLDACALSAYVVDVAHAFLMAFCIKLKAAAQQRGETATLAASRALHTCVLPRGVRGGQILLP